ncbi:MAG TPA: hypothetical protein VFG07_09615 [Thermoplasmata archaeon]|nr:hypothetical protein [Thermoplasmata archaeon]
MATCTDVAAFLRGASAQAVTSHLSPDDLGTLVKLNLIRQLSADDLKQLQDQVASIESARLALSQMAGQRQQEAGELARDVQKSHSILFHLEGVDRQHAALEHLQQEEEALKTLDADLAKRQQDFAQLLLNQAVISSVTPYDAGFLAITTQGRMALRDLTARLYRVGDQAFPAYWQQSARVDEELVSIANSSARIEVTLATALKGVQPAYLWAIGIGLVKTGGDPDERLRNYLTAYDRIKGFSGSENPENLLMAAEILATVPTPLESAAQWLGSLIHEVADLGVPDDARLGVAAILLFGERADGSFATDSLQAYLTKTPSLESAALLAIQNQPFAELSTKFDYLRSLFASWGYSASEDTELSSAYLAASELPLDSVTPKMSIISRGLSGYLQYPLVAAAILSSIPVLEANETLNLMEKAYEILGQRTGPMSQAELISLAVRTIHGVEVRSVDEIDSTAAAVPTAPGFSYANVPPRIWMPVFIAHSYYYSTFSGIGGAHPGHVHVWGGGGFTG